MSFATSPLLEEARHKNRRGKEHSYVLDVELRRFWDTKPYTIAHEYDAKNSKNLFRFKVEKAPPLAAWSLIIGDAVHNARSALDYIAWMLAGSVVDDTTTSFPICSRPEHFAPAAKSKLARVHPEAVADIGRLQPYSRPNLKESALWLLEELDRRDKHRLLTPIEYFPHISSIEVTDPRYVVLPQRVGSRLEHDAVIAEVGGAPNADVEMKGEFTLDILFGRGIISDSDDYEIRGCLERIFDAVDLVIERFDWLLPRNPHWVMQP